MIANDFEPYSIKAVIQHKKRQDEFESIGG